ncbi:hypothetical protein RIF29_42065 [Crotalaria pallida]|uniref:Uncharacterized protein n=1 Tax=Crotalaria pallida TaxID=3830 RepID=A0AAN9HVY2_CROPI
MSEFMEPFSFENVCEPGSDDDIGLLGMLNAKLFDQKKRKRVKFLSALPEIVGVESSAIRSKKKETLLSTYQPPEVPMPPHDKKDLVFRGIPIEMFQGRSQPNNGTSQHPCHQFHPTHQIESIIYQVPDESGIFGSLSSVATYTWPVSVLIESNIDMTYSDHGPSSSNYSSSDQDNLLCMQLNLIIGGTATEGFCTSEHISNNSCPVRTTVGLVIVVPEILCTICPLRPQQA